MTKHILTQEVLKELLHYDPDTGIFVWKYRYKKYWGREGGRKLFNARWAGNEITRVNGKGYLQVCVFGKSYGGHQIAFLYMTGTLPPDQVDHINGLRNDNSWCNLRHATVSMNNRNTKTNKRNKTGLMGVIWDEPTQKYKSYIRVNTKLIHLGYFGHIFAAACARKSSERRYDFHENHSRR